MKRSQSNFCRIRFFTLIELLVVISIIALLIGLLLPALGKARQVASYTKNLAELRGIGTMINVYSSDNNSTAPPGGSEAPGAGPVAWPSHYIYGGRGIYGTPGKTWASGDPYGPKGLGLLVSQYNMPLDYLFTNYKEIFNSREHYSIATSLFTTSPYPSSPTFSYVYRVNNTVRNHTNATTAAPDIGISNVESDWFYRAGNYSINTASNALGSGVNAGLPSVVGSSQYTVAGPDVSLANMKIDSAGYNKKGVVTACRVWFQGRPSRNYSAGIGYEYLFGDASVSFFKIGDGIPSTDPLNPANIPYTYANNLTTSTNTYNINGQQLSQSGNLVFSRGDEYFGR